MPSPTIKKHIDPTSVIVGPRITEKASTLSEKNVFTFDVTKFADKQSVIAAIKALYKVEAIDVKFAPVPSKTVFSRGKVGTRSGGKKAYVQLKKGDTIQFV